MTADSGMAISIRAGPGRLKSDPAQRRTSGRLTSKCRNPEMIPKTLLTVVDFPFLERRWIERITGCLVGSRKRRNSSKERTMRKHQRIATLILIAGALCLVSADTALGAEGKKPGNASLAFEKLKGLVGQWEAI